MRPRDRIKFGVDLKDGRDVLIADALGYAEVAPTTPSPFHIIKARGKDCIFYPDYSVHLTHRVIARYISRRFRIYPLSRAAIVQSVLEALTDSTPMWIIRRDIRSFYETVPTEQLRARLITDTAIPSVVRAHIRCLLDAHSPASRGLPRGVGLAALLAELAMNDFDNAIRGVEGVYRYFRFSDDILIFSFKEPSALIQRLNGELSAAKMRFNNSKSHTVEVRSISKSDPVSLKSFDYLGYNFSFNDRCNTKTPREVQVSISSRKISKLKTRILRSFRAYENDKNYRLLYDRLRYLSANYRVSITRTASGRADAAMAGIYYSYPQCGVYRSGKVGEHSCAEIKAVDGFYHGLLSGPGSQFRVALGTDLTPPEMQSLKRISFFKGFQGRYLMSLSASRISRIKEAWKYVS
jgi:hypothetical protein